MNSVYTIAHFYVLSQLKQDWLPWFCDKGVFCILADIILQRFEEF